MSCFERLYPRWLIGLGWCPRDAYEIGFECGIDRGPFGDENKAGFRIILIWWYFGIYYRFKLKPSRQNHPGTWKWLDIKDREVKEVGK